MANNRYIAQHEFGGDWKVFDSKRRFDVCTGLAQKEAEETANDWNEAESNKEKDFAV